MLFKEILQEAAASSTFLQPKYVIPATILLESDPSKSAKKQSLSLALLQP